MMNIFLAKPAILEASLFDMTESQKKIAADLLNFRKLLTFTESGIHFIPAKEADTETSVYLSGAEAVCAYRQLLGLPDRGIRTVRVTEILSQTDDFDTLSDIVQLLSDVDHANESYRRLLQLDAPCMILWNSYDKLQHAIERLQDNVNCKDRISKCIQTIDTETKDPGVFQKTLYSLMDIGYYLSIIPGVNDMPADDECE